IGRIVAAPILGNALRFVFFLAAGGRSSNGRTPDSGSGYLGSNPSLPANLFFFVANHLTHSRPHLTSLRMAHFAQTRSPHSCPTSAPRLSDRVSLTML